MLKDIIYSFNKLDYYYYFFITLLVFILLHNSNIFNSNNIVNVIITLAIIYFLIKKKILNDYSVMQSHNNKLKQIQIHKYPFIKQDIYIVDCIYKLLNLSYINRLVFNDILDYTNRFFRYYHLSKNTNLKPSNIYHSAKDHSIRVLNSIKSMNITLKNYPYLESNRTITNNKIIQDNSNIENCLNIFENRFSIYLTEMEYNINSDWTKGDINIYSEPIYPDDPEKHNLTDILNSDKYNLF